MTYEELRTKIAEAVEAGRSSPLDCADSILAILREALREPHGRMIYQGGAASDHPTTFLGGPSYEGKTKAARVWRAMLAASPLGGPGHE